MARLPRLALAGHAHCIVQRGHGARAVFVDDHDRSLYLTTLREAAATEHTQVHAWALLDDEVRLLATPEAGPQLARLVQAIGRRYVSAYNRRHGCSGTLWGGRFRSAVLAPGPVLLDALRWVDGASSVAGQTSAAHRTGAGTVTGLTDPPEFWGLGNTPFEREAAYRALLAEGLPRAQQAWLRQAVMGGWVAGDPAFSADVAATSARPAAPRSPGRPRNKRR